MTDPFARWGLFVYRHRRLVVVAWLIALAVCGVFAPKAGDVLKSGGIEVPGSDSAVGSVTLADEFSTSALNNVAVVFRSDSLTVDDSAYRTQVDQAAKRVAAADGVTNVVTYFATRLETLVSKDRHTTIMFASLEGDEGEAQTHVDGVRKALDKVVLEHYVTGSPAVNSDFQTTSEEDLKRAEVLTFALVLLLLLVTFRTVVSAAVPLVLAAAAVVTATAAIYAIGSQTDTSIFALNVASMIGLGLAIDFSLIVVSRFREELATSGDARVASAVTMATAGRSIVYSGMTVMAGMLVLTLLVNLMVIRSISLGVMLVAATALIAGVTLLPAVLGLLSHRLERLRVMPKGKPKPESEGFWYRFSHSIMRRPWAWLAVSVAIILVLALPALRLKMLGATPNVLPSRAESVKGADILDAEFGDNLLTPIQIVLKAPGEGGVFTPRFLTGLDKLTNTLAADPRATQVTSLATYMAAEPRDGRWQNLEPDHDFQPAPDLSHLKPGEVTPGVFLKSFIDVWVDGVPHSPAYFGFGRFRFATGTNRQLQVTPALQVYRVNGGRLKVRAGGAVTLWRRADFGQRNKGKTITAESETTLVTGDQLVVPPQTAVTLRVDGAPVEMIAAVAFHVRPGVEPQFSWLESEPTSDPFAGIQREVIGGGLGMTFPRGETNIKLDLSRTKPGARFPRHLHPGPELIVTQSGTLTIFASPEMVMTGSDGRVKEGKYDTPIALGPGGKAVVQGFGIHRAQNFGKRDAEVWSLRMLDATQPPFTLIAVREFARTFVNLDGANDTTVINVVPRYGPYDNRQQDFVTDVRNLIIPSVPGLSQDHAYVSGTTANFMDFRDKLYGRFAFLVGAVLLLTFFILMMFFQSVFLPLKAILMNVLSILATFGVLVLIFQHGWGSGLFGFDPVGAIGVITPAVLFVILFSLSTDYEVFMLSRIKEYYDRSHDNEESVATGLQHTAGVITAAGLILIGVFGSFAAAGIITIKEIGLGLAIGVLIDTVLVRTIMVPATMRLAGPINWLMPAWLKRIVPELREGPVGDIRVALAGGIGTIRRVVSETVSRPAFRLDHALMAEGPARSWVVRVVGSDSEELAVTGPIELGRDSATELPLAVDDEISRRHVQLSPAPGGVLVEDLGSMNGTYVEERRIEGPTLVPPGGRLRIGETTLEVGERIAPSYVLEIVDAAGERRRLPLGVPLHIGRHRAAGVALVSDDLVSRVHARLTPTEQGVLVEDLGSRNGTFVNGERLGESRVARPGDRILVGGTELELIPADGSASQGRTRTTATT